ncbi:hypothetical protein CJF30_00007478 [Rutstroemia sp. NJR-2017a BBW]|nr:hypothetical protein CJF30_00007478 [Rutstroemia sp. NJR-2017a BBW]
MVQSGKKGNDITNGGTKYRDQQSNMAPQKRDMGDSRGAGMGRSQNGNSSGFRTDSAISGSRGQGERVLQRWVPDKPEETDGSLESAGRGRVGPWDQFAENERRFGLKTDYDENIYTTTIDKSHPLYKQRVAEADKKAREIERSTAMNSHVAEERIADHTDSNENGLDEEDKYSGVRRQDFPPLTSSKDKYQPPGRRGAPVDPAIIASRLAPTDKPATEKPTEKAKPAAATPSPAPNDVAKAFKSFAAHQRNNVNQLRITKAKNDKLVKLNDLKKFANDFKLLTPVPQDLVPIIAKDPAKQKEIQEKAKRNAEEAKLHPVEPAKASTSSSEANGAQRSNATVTAHAASPSGAPGRQQPGRGPYPQASHSFAQNSRGDRPSQAQQPVPFQQSRTTGNLSQRLRNIEQSKPNQVPSNNIPVHEARLPPTGPSNAVEPNFSRRSSGVASAQGGPRLNPNSTEFRPSPFAKDFSPTGNPSSGSSPRSMINPPEIQPSPPVTRSLLRRKPIAAKDRPSLSGKYDAMEHIKSISPPEGRNWNANGGLKPAYDTTIPWKIFPDGEPTESYVQVFEKAPFPAQTPVVSEPHPPHSAPQVAHQHQLPFHLQQGVHNIGARQSPRQPSVNMHGAQMGHGPNPNFGGPDELRMMPSHSAQSYSSPRMQPVPLTFPSPMGQNAQLSYNPQLVPYGGGPMPFRSMSQHQHFMPQQGHMGQPIMMPNPAPGFIPAQGMSPNPQMIYPPGSAQFMPPNNGPPPMPNGGYHSPGRGAPMMMNQGSQQGHQQPMYGMSPGPQYGNVAPVYAQPIPNQMPMRGGFGGPNQYGTSPQQPMHQYGPHRNGNHSNGNYNNKNFQPHGQHPHGPPNNQIPTGPQVQAAGVADESK